MLETGLLVLAGLQALSLVIVCSGIDHVDTKIDLLRYKVDVILREVVDLRERLQ